jgi:integrase
MPRPRRDGLPAAAPSKRKLNDLIVKRLRPTDRPFMVWDSQQRGLAVSVQPTGHKSWKVVYSHHGRPRWYSLGPVDAIGLADARKLAARLMLQVIEGKDPQADRKAARSQGTFAELASRYVAEYSRKKNKSWKQADKLVHKYLLPRWGQLPAATITRTDVKSAIAAIDAPVLANQVLASASAAFSWAVREEILKVNPCQHIERHATTSRERVLSDGEIAKFWTAFDQAGLLQATALKLILLTGQRPGEVSCMRREHIENGWWTLYGVPLPALDWPGTKNGVTHLVWLSKPVQLLLDELWTGQEPAQGQVFPRLGSLDAAMRAICNQLGVNDKVTPHDLRRTFSSKVTGLGFGRDAMNRVTNHKEGGIADVYDRHKYAEENQRIMEAVAARVLALASGEAEPGNVTRLHR